MCLLETPEQCLQVALSAGVQRHLKDTQWTTDLKRHVVLHDGGLCEQDVLQTLFWDFQSWRWWQEVFIWIQTDCTQTKGFSWRPKYLRSYNSTFIRLFVETVRVIYQLQWSQHIFAGFKVVQTGDDGAERSALTNAAQRCHHPVAVIMDVKCQTLLLQDATGTGSDTKLRVWAAVSHQWQWSEAAISPAEPVQAGSCPPSLWLSETKPSPECSLYSSPTAAPERITHTRSRTISSPSSAASVSITRLEPMT